MCTIIKNIFSLDLALKSLIFIMSKMRDSQQIRKIFVFRVYFKSKIKIAKFCK